MADETRSWPRWKKLLVGGAVLLVILLCLCFGLRRPWIEPLPGIRVEPTRPLMRRRDFSPDSPYMRLVGLLVDIPHSMGEEVDSDLLELAGRLPMSHSPGPESSAPPDSATMAEPGKSTGVEPIIQVLVWDCDKSGWSAGSQVEWKFNRHSWPTNPPPPAPPPEPLFEYVGDPLAEQPVLDYETGRPIHRTPWHAVGSNAPWTLEQYQEVQRVLAGLETHMPTLDRILADSAARMPTAEMGEDFEVEKTNVSLLSKWLHVGGRVKMKSGDCLGAARDICRLNGLARMADKRGYPGFCHEADFFAMAISLDLIMCADAPASVLKELARGWLVHDEEMESFADSFRSLCLVYQSIIPDLYQEVYTECHPLDVPTSFHVDDWTHFCGQLLLLMAPIAGSTPEATDRNVRAVFQHLIALGERPYSAAYQTEYDSFQENLYASRSFWAYMCCYRDPVGLMCFFDSKDYGVSHDFPLPWHGAYAKWEARRRGMVLLLALRAYELEHGRVPETLDALVPECLPRIPEDPFAAGQLFRYLPRDVPGLPPEAWAVYSVGYNITDDGGVAFMPSLYTITCPDLVFPSRPYPPEWREKAEPPPASPAYHCGSEPDR